MTRTLHPARRGWLYFGLFVGLTGTVSGLLWRHAQHPIQSLPSVLIGQPAPRFALPSLTDSSRSIDSRALAGAPYLFNVWASWCASCAAEQPSLQHFASRNPIPVIGYNWKDNRQDALAWLARQGNPYRVTVTDDQGEMAVAWGIIAVPETFLVDQQGRIRWQFRGPLTPTIIETQLEPALRKLSSHGNHFDSQDHSR